MVKIINIDTKTRTIRVENADGDIKTWRTTESGVHFPIKKGESTKEALDKFVEKKRPEAKKDDGEELETMVKAVEKTYGKDSPEAQRARGKLQPKKESDFDEATWAKAYTQAMKKYGQKKGGLNAPTVDEVKAQYDILKKQPAKKESTTGAKTKASELKANDIISKDGKQYKVEGFLGRGAGAKLVLKDLGTGAKTQMPVSSDTTVQKQQPAKKGFKGDDVSYEQWTKRYDVTPEQRLDEAFEFDDLDEEWKKAKKNFSYHGVSASTVEDILDYVVDTDKYHAEDIVEALQSKSHDKIDQLREEAKKYHDKWSAKFEKEDLQKQREEADRNAAKEKERQDKIKASRTSTMKQLQAKQKSFTKEEYDALREMAESDDTGLHEVVSKAIAKKESGPESFKSAMQTTMKAFPRLYDFEKPHLEEFANKVYDDIQNNPGKEKEVLEHLADAYQRHIAGLGPWVDTPTLAKKAFLDQMLESHLNKQSEDK